MTNEIGFIVRQLRSEAGYNRTELGAYADVSPRTIERLEVSGMVTLSSLERILEAMDYELEIVPRDGIGPRRD
jgi:DNA-binding XRE family transcriptional regulator